MSSRSLMLVCEGLDTIATVYVNNKVVGKSDNMFVRYVFDIKPATQVYFFMSPVHVFFIKKKYD
jgi:beta-mannosidase